MKLKRSKRREQPQLSDEELLEKNRIRSIEADREPSGGVKKPLLIAGIIALVALVAFLVIITLFYDRPGSFLAGGKKKKGEGTSLIESVKKKQTLDSDNVHIKRGKESYARKYYHDAATEFQEVVDSDAGDRDKAIALTYLGMIADDQEKYKDAIELYRRALTYDRDNPEILKNLALAYRNSDNTSSAIENARKALELDKTNPDARILLGNLYYASADYARAIEEYRKALQARPEDATVMYNLGSALIKSGDEFAGIEYFKKAAAKDRIGEVAHRAYSRLGVHYTERGVFDTAETYLKQAVALRPADPVNRYNLGIAYLRQKKTDDALRELAEAEKLSEKDSELLQNIGDVYLSMKDYDRSLAAYEKVRGMKKRNIGILARIAEIHYEKGELDRAYELYKKITMIEPATENARAAWLNMGKILIDSLRYGEAVQAFEKALTINPKDDAALYHLGIAFKHNGKPEKAIRTWRKSASLDRKNPRALLAIAEYYYESGHYDLAEKEYQQIAQNWPRLQEAHFKMGAIYYKRGQKDYALQAFRKTVDIDSSGDLARKALINMAIINSEKDSTEAGISRSMEMVQKALLLKPNDPEALYSYGVLLAKRDRQEKAIETFYQVIKSTRKKSLLSRSYNSIGKSYYRQQKYRKALEAFTRGLEEDPANEEMRMNRKAASQAYEKELARER